MSPWWLVIGLGMVASSLTSSITMPASRELMIKLGTLISWSQRQNPALFREKLEPINPFVGNQFKFVHKRLTSVLRTDFTEFGPICQQLHGECKKLDRRAHIGMIPVGIYVIGVGIWWFVS